MDSIKGGFNQLLEKRMDRREFLGFMGIIFLSIIGVTRVMQAFNIPVPSYTDIVRAVMEEFHMADMITSQRMKVTKG